MGFINSAHWRCGGLLLLAFGVRVLFDSYKVFLQSTPGVTPFSQFFGALIGSTIAAPIILMGLAVNFLPILSIIVAIILFCAFLFMMPKR